MSEPITNMADAVAALGAVPMPVGPEPVDPQAAVEQVDFLHRVTLPELRREVEHHKAGKARWRARAEKAEARVSELELELAAARQRVAAVGSSAKQLLRARSDDAANDVSRPVARLRALLAGQREAVDGEHYATVHHDYRTPRDLPELGGPR